MNKYEMATVVFGAKFNFPFTEFFLKDYLYTGDKPCKFVVEVTMADIEHERAQSPEFSDEELENVALLRKLCEQLLDKEEIIMFHSSAIEVDGEAYLFTAPSGTGKSTHSALWIKYFGDRASYINDDKPFIKADENGVTVYGNPWTGKHCLGNKTQARVKGICKLSQAKVNKISKVSSTEFLFTLLDQTERPEAVESMDKLLGILERVLTNVNAFHLECDISVTAVEVAYNAMAKGEYN